MDNLSHNTNPTTADDLSGILAEIERKAAAQNLHIVRGLPTNYKPTLAWQGDLSDYIESAALARAAILYVRAAPFDLEKENTALSCSQQGLRVQQLRTIDPDQNEQDQWLLQRLNEQTASFTAYEPQLGAIRCAWFADGISHNFNISTSWYTDYEAAASRALDESEVVEIENRRLRDEEASFFLLQAAREVASHERFPDASNNEKRAYMVDQIYPGLSPQQRTEVVGLAQAIYWWEIAPAENANREQQIRDLRSKGETIKNIAALLRIPETRVRAILES